MIESDQDIEEENNAKDEDGGRNLQMLQETTGLSDNVFEGNSLLVDSIEICLALMIMIYSLF